MRMKNIYQSGGELPEESRKQIEEAIDKLFPTDILDTLDRNRPYNGQPWTDDGERGKQEVHGLTMRDIKDCFVRACYDSAPIPESEYPKSIYDLPWGDIDIMAVCKNMSCWVERYMGIFPNVGKFNFDDVMKDVPMLDIDDLIGGSK